MLLSTAKRFAIGLALWGAGARAEMVSLNLKDGSVVRGEIVARTDSTVTLRNEAMGEITLRARDLIAPILAPAPAAPASAQDPSDQALFFMPTAFMPPARAFTFRDFELLFMTFGYSPAARTSLSVGFLFPVTPEFLLVTAGLKQNLWSGASGAISLTGNVTKPFVDLESDDGFFANSNLVASKRFLGPRGKRSIGVHGAIGYLGHQDYFTKHDPLTFRSYQSWKWQGSLDFGLGAEAVLTPHAKFLIEYVSAAPFTADNSFKGGFLTLGFRLHGERLAADIAGIRPFVSGGTDDLLLWPLLVVSYRI
jgi:hypothetical protein